MTSSSRVRTEHQHAIADVLEAVTAYVEHFEPVNVARQRALALVLLEDASAAVFIGLATSVPVKRIAEITREEAGPRPAQGSHAP